MKNIVISALIVLTFICFCAFEIQRHSLSVVLNIITPSIVQVDTNKNGKIDSDETFCIPDVFSLTSNLSENQDKLTDILKISREDGIRYGYLADNFAENTLADKKVKVRKTGKFTEKCSYADIIINNESYRNKLLLSGYGFSDKTKNKKFDENLSAARKLDLVILNHKSNKYHKLDCEYGLAAHDSIIIPKKYIKDSKPCKFCHITKSSKTNSNNAISTYPLIVSQCDKKLYLTDSTLKLTPDNKCDSTVCQMLLKEIKNSKEKIDIALYGWGDVPPIYNELLKAKQRGVKIRIVYDVSKNNYYPKTENFVLSLADEKAHDSVKSLMHNKFIIIDDKKLITGSMNFSQTGLSGFNTNSVLLINSENLAQIFEKEFEQMLIGKFQKSKRKTNVKTVIINNSKITPLFSPQDKIIVNYLIPLINSAKSYIYIPTFTLTHKELANSIKSAQKRGVDVKIIVDATKSSGKNSLIKDLRANNIQVKTENYAGKLHSKSIIIDDKYVILGSMNFTYSGENYNDENSLIIEDAKLAKFYKGFFNYYWSKIPDKYLKFNPPAEGKTSIGSCSDGIDNNYDGKIDKDDKYCR